MTTYVKDPDGYVDYQYDWSRVLATGETIVTSVWTVPTGLTSTTETQSTTTATIWISGGTLDAEYEISNRITTSAGRIYDYVFTLRIGVVSATVPDEDSHRFTARTLIRRALQVLGVVAAGEQPTAQEAMDGLDTLNDLIDNLGASGLSMFTRTRVIRALVANRVAYTIGPGGYIDRARPSSIVEANIIDTTVTPNDESPLDVLDDDRWRAVSQKSLTSTRPAALYYAPTFPLGTISLWPVCTVSTISLSLYLLDPISMVDSLATWIEAPPGYRKFLRYQLALELAPEYNVTPSQVVVEMARQASGDLKRANYRPTLLRCDPAVLGDGSRANIRTGP